MISSISGRCERAQWKCQIMNQSLLIGFLLIYHCASLSLGSDNHHDKGEIVSQVKSKSISPYGGLKSLDMISNVGIRNNHSTDILLDINTINQVLKSSLANVTRYHKEKGFKRLSYNISIPQPNLALTNLTGIDLKHQNRTHSSNLSETEDLIISDTRFVPQSMSSSRYDEDFDSLGQTDFADSSQPLEDDSLHESISASSNLNEQKAVRELKKIISRGMSSAIDPMKLETLEDFRRRQKERRAVKDKRAKIFEDILTSAIETHPDNEPKTKQRHQSKKTREEPQKSASILGGIKSDMDPELMGDAELVLHHLQGLASTMDGHSPSWPGEQVESSQNEETGSQANADGVVQSPANSYNEEEQSNLSDKNKPKKSVVGNRYITKGFKRLKQTISQRRKQLEQIKKMFNVELALNAKDGSLVGKSPSSSSSSTKKSKTIDANDIDNGDYTVVDDSTLSNAAPVTFESSPRSRRKSGEKSPAKMRELRKYLMENPDILASVMAELTVDADPSASTRDTGDSDLDRKYNREVAGSSHHGTSSSSKRSKHVTNDVDENESEPLPPRRWKYLRDRHSRSDRGPSFLRGKSAELTLIESLRDRQLLNLARLENILAEKHGIVPNRSQSSSNPISSQSINYDKIHPNNYDSRGVNRVRRHNQSEEDHHFLYVQNQGSYESQPGRIFSSETPVQTMNSNQMDTQNGQPMISPDVATNSNRVSRQQQQPQPQLQQQTQPNPLTLNRFKEWRDVSQTEVATSMQPRVDRVDIQNNSTPIYQQNYDMSGGVGPQPQRDTNSYKSNPQSSDSQGNFNTINQGIGQIGGVPQRQQQVSMRPSQNVEPMPGAITQPIESQFVSQGINRGFNNLAHRQQSMARNALDSSSVGRQNVGFPFQGGQAAEQIAPVVSPLDAQLHPQTWPMIPTIFMSRSSAATNSQALPSNSNPTIVKFNQQPENNNDRETDHDSGQITNQSVRQNSRRLVGRNKTPADEKQLEEMTPTEGPAQDTNFWIDEQPESRVVSRPIANYFQAYKDEIGSRTSSRDPRFREREQRNARNTVLDENDAIDEMGAMWAKS